MCNVKVSTSCISIKRPIMRLGRILSFISKTAADQLSPILTRLYQYYLGIDEFGWLTTSFGMFFLYSRKEQILSNYRSVSFASVVCKVHVHETIVYDSVMYHFDRNRTLTGQQHGFKARKSCKTQLIT